MTSCLGFHGRPKTSSDDETCGDEDIKEERDNLFDDDNNVDTPELGETSDEDTDDDNDDDNDDNENRNNVHTTPPRNEADIMEEEEENNNNPA